VCKIPDKGYKKLCIHLLKCKYLGKRAEDRETVSVHDPFAEGIDKLWVHVEKKIHNGK